MVSRPIGSGNTRSIKRKRNIEPHQHHIVEYLIVSPLQKRRVDRRNRLQAFGRHTGCEGYRVFGDRGIECAIRELFHYLAEPRAVGHRRGQRYDAVVFLHQVDCCLREHRQCKPVRLPVPL